MKYHMPDWLDERDFYEVMQACRQMSRWNAEGTIETFEAVKEFIRNHMHGWRPIATAPYGKPILVTDGKVRVAVEFELIGKETYINATGVHGYDYDFDFELKDLTHWMPLPEMPRTP